jgi:UPF0755 protein
MKRILAIAGILAFMAGAAALFASQQYQRFLATPLSLPVEPFVFQIEPGTSGSSIIKRLAGSGFTRYSWQWKLLMRLEPPAVKAGEYQLDPGIAPRELLQLLSSGAVVQYHFTLVEGWTFTQLLQALAKDEVLKQTLDPDSSEAGDEAGAVLISSLGVDHPEGWFFPETYQFTRGDSDSNILDRAHKAMEKELGSAWKARNDDLPLNSPYELLILASIIEKETGKEEERGQISGVFIRRLQKGMRLQTDPTVIYGMGDSFDGNIRHRDLKTDTPYNTYTRSGLPPTPIAMPGRASLLAAARPDAGDAFYFVADGTGGHTFSATLQEHQEAVNKLIKRN